MNKAILKRLEMACLENRACLLKWVFFICSAWDFSLFRISSYYINNLLLKTGHDKFSLILLMISVSRTLRDLSDKY